MCLQLTTPKFAQTPLFVSAMNSRNGQIAEFSLITWLASVTETRYLFAFELGPVYIQRVQSTVATRLIIAAKHISVFS
jgi:hypothetical protein